MYQFHTAIHVRPAEANSGPAIKLGDRKLTVLDVPRAVLAAPFALSFEEASQRLGGLERLFIEPDGSFVWVSPQSAAPWQLDGNLFDRAGRLLFVDLKGTCPPAVFDRLLAALGWPVTPLMFELVREAVLLDEAEFRRWVE